jgi:NitT/TauT family transport system substrate-binding protein
MPRYRRSLACGLALALTAGAASAATVRVGTSSAQAFNFMPLDIGIKQGAYRRHGLDVQVVELEGSGKLHQAMVAGGIDLGLGAGTDIAFLVKGAAELGVAAIALSPALFGIVVPYDSPARTLADLKGKRIGISTVGSLTQWLAFQLEKKEGWPIDNLTFITDGSTTAPQVAALTSGQVDAQVGAAAMGWNLEEQKKGRVLAPAADFVGPFLQNVIYASDAMIGNHPDEVRAFLAGWYEAVAFMATHRTETIAAETAIDGFSQAVNEKQYDAVMPSQSRDGTFPPEAVAKVAQSFVELHILPVAPDMSKYLTPQFLPPHG